MATDSAAQSDALTRIDAIIESLARSAAASGALVRRLSTLAQLTKTMFDAMEFGFLFDPTRKLFSIGYRVSDNSLDPSCYDLLASEARLTSFIAIAKGDVPSTALVPPRSRFDARRPGICARLLVRVDVRVPHARARHALSVG